MAGRPTADFLDTSNHELGAQLTCIPALEEVLPDNSSDLEPTGRHKFLPTIIGQPHSMRELTRDLLPGEPQTLDRWMKLEFCS